MFSSSAQASEDMASDCYETVRATINSICEMASNTMVTCMTEKVSSTVFSVLNVDAPCHTSDSCLTCYGMFVFFHKLQRTWCQINMKL